MNRITCVLCQTNRVAKQQNLEFEIQREASAPPEKRNSSKVSAATRPAKLWRSIGPVNSIAAISSDKGVLTHEADKAHELGCVWARTFSKVGGVSREATFFLDAQKTNGNSTPFSLLASVIFVTTFWALKTVPQGPMVSPILATKPLLGYQPMYFSVPTLSF